MENFKKEFAELKQNGENSKMKWLRSRDVRKMLGVQDSTLQQMRIRGDFPAYKLGGIWYYLEDEINEAILNVKICNN
jgi:predicted DNA-binding transcriptional regulator AlpA